VAHFLASAQVKLPHAYRVLKADGTIPDEGMLNWLFRGGDLHRLLADEGIEFAGGRAEQRQRLTADALKELLADRKSEEEQDTPAPAKRAWMVRGSNVDGFNLVHDWLQDGFVSLSASQLGQLGPAADYEELKQAVETGYQHKSYAYRGQRLEELDRFLRRVREGDLVLTPMQGGGLRRSRIRAGLFRRWGSGTFQPPPRCPLVQPGAASGWQPVAGTGARPAAEPGLHRRPHRGYQQLAALVSAPPVPAGQAPEPPVAAPNQPGAS